MGFLSRILNTKKVKEIKKDIKNISKNIDDKFDVSEKIENAKDSVTETVKKVEDKIENSLNGKISFDTFSKVELRIGEIISAEKVEKSDKLLKLKVNFSENEDRQIVSGIALSYNPDDIVGKKVLFATNIEPRKIFGLESDGMILGVKDHEGNFSLLSPEKECGAGVKVG